jgi:hypothetical protein
MTLYVVAILSVCTIFALHRVHGLAIYILAVLPAVPLLGVIAAFGMYLTEETDEFVRTVMVQSSLWATGILLSLSTFWGFLENYTKVAHIPMFYAFVVWWAAFGLIQPLVYRRYR